MFENDFYKDMFEVIIKWLKLKRSQQKINYHRNHSDKVYSSLKSDEWDQNEGIRRQVNNS